MKKQVLFTGAGVALITPMYPDGSINFEKLEELVEWHIANRTDALIVCGTTGEAPTLSSPEHLEALRVAIDRAAHRIPVIAGVFANSTAAAIDGAKSAEAIGVDGLLISVPGFSQPEQRGLRAHFSRVADSVSVPMLVYNNPARLGVDLKPNTMADLLQHENIVGIKESSGSIQQVMNLAALCPDCDIYAGNDDQVLPVLSLGGKGVISTIANIMPDVMHAMCEAFFKGDHAAAQDMQIQIFPLWQAAFVETSPVPVKAMMSLMKLCEEDVRLPLVPLSEESMGLIRETLEAYQLI